LSSSWRFEMMRNSPVKARMRVDFRPIASITPFVLS
jgi:hypothetical protein